MAAPHIQFLLPGCPHRALGWPYATPYRAEWNKLYYFRILLFQILYVIMNMWQSWDGSVMQVVHIELEMGCFCCAGCTH